MPYRLRKRSCVAGKRIPELKNRPMIGSTYLESPLRRTWPVFTPRECVVCGEKFVRQWMWKFNPKRRHALERPQERHACYACTTNGYNDAVTVLNKFYRSLEFERLRRYPYQR